MAPTKAHIENTNVSFKKNYKDLDITENNNVMDDINATERFQVGNETKE